MSGRPSLSDKAVRLCSLIEQTEAMLRSVNDYGEATGFCQEHDQIANDAHNIIGMLSARAYTLQQRYKRTLATVK